MSDDSKAAVQVLDVDAGFAIAGSLVASCASVYCTTALLACNVPCAFDSGAILSFADRSTTAARFKFVGGVEALEVLSRTVHAGDGTCMETHRTLGDV